MKKTAVAPSNIAFTKYWGKKDEKLRIPENGSISMNLSNLLTTTTVEFLDEYKKDEIHLPGEIDRVIKHLDRIRKIAGIHQKAKVVSENNFPTGTGLSSSASGFAALTVAASFAASLQLSEKELSILARQGSGSACRSIPNGFVEWFDGNTSETSYAIQIFKEDYYDIADVVVVASSQKKDVSTSVGQKTAESSPFMAVRLSRMKKKNEDLKKLIQKRDFESFGELVEQEALELHAIMLTQKPPLIYFKPETIVVIKAVEKWRIQGIPVYWTLNTGQDVHLICQGKDKEKVATLARTLSVTKDVIINLPSSGAHLVKEHLF
ncbi:diphosphomevalonate decarboxylase [Candidatus Shapirobacteria bacterium]|nr:diphosphomevalonate decarboxylase [Candidatus Shapirobacteria bacterium]